MGRPNLDPATSFLKAPDIRRLFSIFQTSGYQVFFVGGCVRNAILGVAQTDIDLATDARPETVVTLAEENGFKSVPTGIEHGTVTIVDRTIAVEVTTFRKDVETDGRRAVVAFSESIDDDARRRDFTMNAIYADLEGTIVDPVGGYTDARMGRVRFIDDASLRIREDYLRILRFFRFHAWYADPEKGFDSDALAAIAGALDGLSRLSAERVGAEILKLLTAKDPGPAVACMLHLGVLHKILPGSDPRFLVPLVHLEQSNALAPDPITRLAVLAADNARARLRLSKKQAKQLEAICAPENFSRSPRVLGHCLGASSAKGALLQQAVMQNRDLPKNWREDLEYGENTLFPVSARDFPHLQGARLGQRLKALRETWLQSDMTKSKQELLRE